jgi:hypothetical protein
MLAAQAELDLLVLLRDDPQLSTFPCQTLGEIRLHLKHPAQDQKILEHFLGLVVRKDLITKLKQNAVAPT